MFTGNPRKCVRTESNVHGIDYNCLLSEPLKFTENFNPLILFAAKR
jgi:hypothetical protein